MTLQRRPLTRAAIPCAISRLPALAQVVRSDAAVTVEDVLDGAVWQTGFTNAANAEENRGNPEPRDIQSRIKSAFYIPSSSVAVECDGPCPQHLRVSITDHDNTVWADDSIKTFLDPATDASVDVRANSRYAPLQIDGRPSVQLVRMTPDRRAWGAVVTPGAGAMSSARPSPATRWSSAPASWAARSARPTRPHPSAFADSPFQGGNP